MTTYSILFLKNSLFSKSYKAKKKYWEKKNTITITNSNTITVTAVFLSRISHRRVNVKENVSCGNVQIEFIFGGNIC